MKETKKADSVKVLRVAVILYTILVIAASIYTVYGWVTGTGNDNYMGLACLVASYCALAGAYETTKKKNDDKKDE